MVFDILFAVFHQRRLSRTHHRAPPTLPVLSLEHPVASADQSSKKKKKPLSRTLRMRLDSRPWTHRECQSDECQSSSVMTKREQDVLQKALAVNLLPEHHHRMPTPKNWAATST